MLLIRASSRQNSRLVPMSPDKLNSDGQSGFGKAARKSDGRMAGKVCRPADSYERGTHRLLAAIDGNFLLADLRRCDRSCRRDERIGALKRRVEILQDPATGVRSAQVIKCAYGRSLLESLSHILTIGLCARRIVPRRFMIVARFGQRDLCARISG